MSETVRVRRVIDGDTIELDRPDPTGTYPFERVRLIRITAPELDARSQEARTVAYAATKFLRRLVAGREVILEGSVRDKFHRLLARVRIVIKDEPGAPAPETPPEPQDVEALLVAAGYARWWTDVLRERQEHAKTGR